MTAIETLDMIERHGGLPVNESKHKEKIIKHLLDTEHEQKPDDAVDVWISKNGRIYFGAGTEDLDSIICRHIRAAIECNCNADHNDK